MVEYVTMPRRASIRRKLFAMLVAITMVVFLFGAVMFALYEKRNLDLSYTTLYETLDTFSRSVERELASVERLATDVMSDYYIQERMARLAEIPREYEWYQISDDLVRRLLIYTRPPAIPAIVLMDSRGRAVNSRNDFPDFNSVVAREAIEDFRASEEPYRWIVTPSEQSRLFLLRRIREARDLSFRYLGTEVVVLNKRFSMRQTTAHPFQEDLQIAILHDGMVAFAAGPDIESVLEERPPNGTPYEIREIGGTTQFLAQVSSADRPLRYIYMLPYDLLFSDIQRLSGLLIAFAVVLFLLVVSLLVWVAQSVSSPIIRLANTMRALEEQGFTQTKLQAQSYDRPDEIGVLYHEFAVMLERIDTLINESYRTQLALKDVQFRSLQAQINPHFLYNTLESINWLAQLNEEPQIADMVQALGGLFRASVDTRRVIVTVAEELELVRKYVLIQRTRYGDRLVVRLDEPGPAAETAIPKLTLQPLLENSIKYGLESAARPCDIAVSIEQNGGRMRVAVADDGPGMSEELVSAVLDGQVEPRGSGLGIKNIHERIERLYGGRGSVKIESEPGHGTRVVIEVPVLSEKELSARIEGYDENT